MERACRYCILNFCINAKAYNHRVRKHWGIENNLHWQLDVSFNEDKQRKRKGDAV